MRITPLSVLLRWSRWKDTFCKDSPCDSSWHSTQSYLYSYYWIEIVFWDSFSIISFRLFHRVWDFCVISFQIFSPWFINNQISQSFNPRSTNSPFSSVHSAFQIPLMWPISKTSAVKMRVSLYVMPHSVSNCCKWNRLVSYDSLTPLLRIVINVIVWLHDNIYLHEKVENSSGNSIQTRTYWGEEHEKDRKTGNWCSMSTEFQFSKILMFWRAAAQNVQVIMLSVHLTWLRWQLLCHTFFY